jgi:site-specific recombinase XerD
MDRSQENRAETSQAVEQLLNCDPAAHPRLATTEPVTDLTDSRGERRRQQKQARKQMRGFGSVFCTKWRDKKTGLFRYSPKYTIKYYRNGEPIRELTDCFKESDAWKLLKKRHAEIDAGRPVGPDVERTTFEDMVMMLINDYKANGRRSINRVEDAVNHLRVFFGDSRVKEITSDRVTTYIAARQLENAASSTINCELAALGRMFTLAVRAGKATSKPFISKLQLSNARRGFFERQQFDAVLANIPDHLRAMLETAYATGWRVHAEILTREKRHLDLKAGWLRLDPDETKNREGRMFPLTHRLREILREQIAKNEVLQKATQKIIPWLFFHSDGKRIKHFRRSWITACISAGLGRRIIGTNGRVIKAIADRIPHDFRRTAVRNLERAGVPRSAAMRMVGHKTQAIYARYAIADEGMLKDAAVKLELLHMLDQQPKQSANGQSTGKADDRNGDQPTPALF